MNSSCSSISTERVGSVVLSANRTEEAGISAKRICNAVLSAVRRGIAGMSAERTCSATIYSSLVCAIVDGGVVYAASNSDYLSYDGNYYVVKMV